MLVTIGHYYNHKVTESLMGVFFLDHHVHQTPVYIRMTSASVSARDNVVLHPMALYCTVPSVPAGPDEAYAQAIVQLS